MFNVFPFVSFLAFYSSTLFIFFCSFCCMYFVAIYAFPVPSEEFSYSFASLFLSFSLGNPQLVAWLSRLAVSLIGV